MNSRVTKLLLFLITFAATELALARNVYLNGIDISSSRHQFLQNVNVRVDGNGHIFIEAPHYQVNEENTYTPLSQWREQTVKGHQPPSELKDLQSKVGATQPVPETKAANTAETSGKPSESPVQPPIPPGQPKVADDKDMEEGLPAAPAQPKAN